MEPMSMGIGLLTNFVQQDMAARKSKREQYLAQQETNRMAAANKFNSDAIFLQSFPTSGVAQTSFAKYGGWVSRLKKMGKGGRTSPKSGDVSGGYYNQATYDPDADTFKAQYSLPTVDITAEDPRVKNAVRQGRSKFLTDTLDLMGEPQRRMVQGVTGKNQTPSEAWGFNQQGLPWYNPKNIADFAMDAVLDPTNLAGVGLVKSAAKKATKRSMQKSVLDLDDIDLKTALADLDLIALSRQDPKMAQLLKSKYGEFYKDQLDLLLPADVQPSLVSPPKKVYRSVYNPLDKPAYIQQQILREIGTPITSTARAKKKAVELNPGVYTHGSNYNVGMSTTTNKADALNIYGNKFYEGGTYYNRIGGEQKPATTWLTHYKVSPESNILDSDSYSRFMGEAKGKGMSIKDRAEYLKSLGYDGIKKWYDSSEIQFLDPSKSLTPKKTKRISPDDPNVHAFGGSVLPDYIAEGGEVVDFNQGNVPQPGNFGKLNRLSSSSVKIEGDSHDDPSGGVEMTGGERVFSDRLYASSSFRSKLRKV
jgi:hypothetical protein